MVSRAFTVALDLHVMVAGATMHPRTCFNQAAAPGSSRNSSGVMLKSPPMIQGPPYMVAASPAARSKSRFRSVAPSMHHMYTEIKSKPPLSTPSIQAAASFPGEAGGERSHEIRPSGAARPMCLLVAMAAPPHPLCPLPSTASAPCRDQFNFLAACCRSVHFSPDSWCSWQQTAATSKRSSACSPFLACQCCRASFNCGPPDELSVTITASFGLEPRVLWFRWHFLPDHLLSSFGRTKASSRSTRLLLPLLGVLSSAHSVYATLLPPSG